MDLSEGTTTLRHHFHTNQYVVCQGEQLRQFGILGTDGLNLLKKN